MTGPGGLKEAGTAVVSRGEGRVRAPCWGYDFAAFSGPPLHPSADERKIINFQRRVAERRLPAVAWQRLFLLRRGALGKPKRTLRRRAVMPDASG